MPKRVIDGESLWQSSKLSQVQPLKYRGELANLLPLMSVNGSFEADARLIWVQVYGFNRPDVKLKDVEGLLKEFERVKILFRWKAEDGKVWGYFVGVEKTGRLPPPSKRYSDAASTDIPAGLLAAFVGGKAPSRYCPPTEGVSDGYTGNGTGLSEGTSLGLSRSGASIGTGTVIPNVDPILSSTSTSLDAEQEDRKIQVTQDSSIEAIRLALLFHQLVQDNPSFEFAPSNWKSLWASDFTNLLQDYSYEECEQLIRTSQKGNWQKYIIRPMALVKKAAEIWAVAKKLATTETETKKSRFIDDSDEDDAIFNAAFELKNKDEDDIFNAAFEIKSVDDDEEQDLIE
jgi:hypothetical protein